MNSDKSFILENLCYTELVYTRINKKLGIKLSRGVIEEMVAEILEEANESAFCRVGKNIYVSDVQKGIRLTINSFTCRIITADRLPVTE